MIEGTFKFIEQFGELEFANPTIQNIPRSSITMSETESKINALVVLVGDGYKIGIQLTDIVVNDFDYNPGQLIERVVTRLEDFKI